MAKPPRTPSASHGDDQGFPAPMPDTGRRYVLLEDGVPESMRERAYSQFSYLHEQIVSVGLAFETAQEGAAVSMTAGAELRYTATFVRSQAHHLNLLAARAFELAGNIDGVAEIFESEQRGCSRPVFGRPEQEGSDDE